MSQGLDPATIILAIESHDHGGEGELTATLHNNSIIVTGEVTGMTQGLVLENGEFPVIVQAQLSGNPAGGEALITSNSWLFIADGAEIFTIGRAIEAYDVMMAGGLIVAAEAIIAAERISINGGTVNGSLRLTNPLAQLSISSNAQVNAYSIEANWHVDITENAQVAVENLAGLANTIVYIAQTAETNFEDRLSNFILRMGDGVDMVVGTVTLDHGEFTVGLGQTLYIPEGAKLTIGESEFSLNGGVIIVDGTLVLPDGVDLSAWEGYVTGENAGELAGDWTNTQPWHQGLPRWIQWVLRWIFFGWAWM